MKITGGFLKGKRVNCPRGQSVRPTSSKIREALFNVLFSLDINLDSIKFLDLFAGTGMISFEAISRGTGSSVMIDNNLNSVKTIMSNAESLSVTDKVIVRKMDVLKYVDTTDLSNFGIVFVDPPYNYKGYTELINIFSHKLSPGAVIIIESGKENIFMDKLPLNFEIIKEKKWGQTYLKIIKIIR